MDTTHTTYQLFNIIPINQHFKNLSSLSQSLLECGSWKVCGLGLGQYHELTPGFMIHDWSPFFWSPTWNWGWPCGGNHGHLQETLGGVQRFLGQSQSQVILWALEILPFERCCAGVLEHPSLSWGGTPWKRTIWISSLWCQPDTEMIYLTK